MSGEREPIHVLMVGPALEVRGGVSSLENLIFQYKPSGVDLVLLPTMHDTSNVRKIAFFALALLRLAGILFSHKVDLLHVHFSIRASVLRKIVVTAFARACGKPYILHAHGAEFHEYFPTQSPLLQKHIIRMLHGARRLLVLSSSWQQYYLDTFKLPENKTVVLPNAIELPATLPNRAHRDTVTLSFLGRMEERKGHLRVLHALRSLPEDVLQKVRLVMAGDGDVKGTRHEVSHLGLEKHVTVMDWVSAQQRNILLASADVFVLPSLNEGLPMSVLEAMSWGLPVITSPVGGIPEIVRDGFNGLLVPPTDIPALANAMQTLIEDEALRLQMGANARASVEHLDIRLYWEKLYDIYRSVLSESKR